MHDLEHQVGRGSRAPVSQDVYHYDYRFREAVPKGGTVWGDYEVGWKAVSHFTF